MDKPAPFLIQSLILLSTTLLVLASRAVCCIFCSLPLSISSFFLIWFLLNSFSPIYLSSFLSSLRAAFQICFPFELNFMLFLNLAGVLLSALHVVLSIFVCFLQPLMYSSHCVGCSSLCIFCNVFHQVLRRTFKRKFGVLLCSALQGALLWFLNLPIPCLSLNYLLYFSKMISLIFSRLSSWLYYSFQYAFCNVFFVFGATFFASFSAVLVASFVIQIILVFMNLYFHLF